VCVHKLMPLGYHCAYMRVDTKQFYIPHTRTRVYLVATRGAEPGLPRQIMSQVREMERPASASLEAFLLPHDDPRVMDARRRLANRKAKGDTVTDWSKCEARHQRCRTDEQVGAGARCDRDRDSDCACGCDCCDCVCVCVCDCACASAASSRAQPLSAPPGAPPHPAALRRAITLPPALSPRTRLPSPALASSARAQAAVHRLARRRRVPPARLRLERLGQLADRARARSDRHRLLARGSAVFSRRQV
jgi:site-specific DNA-cytosine methylase